VKLALKFKDYLKPLSSMENQPLTLDVALKPFGIRYPYHKSFNLVMGHLIDYLRSEFESSSSIDPMDVCIAAWELGHQEAQPFMENPPRFINR
jgi:hypothetical protein